MTAVDLTAGRGGHAVQMAKQVGPTGSIALFDLDRTNLDYAAKRVERVAGLKPLAFPGSFASIGRSLAGAEVCGDGFLADLGFASNQVADAERGFSFKADGPIDMRMDTDSPLKAEDLLASLSLDELAKLIREYGEDPMANRIASKIVAARAVTPIQSTAYLAQLVCEAYGPHRTREARVHPATRTFQALRIAVNDELGALKAMLDEFERAAIGLGRDRVGWLAPGARLVVISFHSLEDRLVKKRFAAWGQAGLLKDRAAPMTGPTDAESAANPRARSAKLRWVAFRPLEAARS